MININKIIAQRCIFPQSSILNPQSLTGLEKIKQAFVRLKQHRTNQIKITKNVLMLLFLLMMPIISFASLTQLNRVNLVTAQHHARLVFSFNHAFQYRTFTLKKPDRLVIDLSNTQLATRLNKINFYHSDILSVNYGEHQQHHTLRLVFALKQNLNPVSFVQKPRGRFGYRLVVDLVSSKENIVNKPSIVPSVKPPKVVMDQAEHIKNLREAIIVIDPGHGGKDPGATGLHGTHEKNIVLAVGKDLYNLLKQNPDIHPELTRSGDYFVPLRGRLRLARKGRADLFIAIHADAYRDRYARGASVFALSQRGASSEAARWLAQKENYSELGGVADFEDKSFMVRSVLIDLSQTATTRESLHLGNCLINSLRHVARLHRGYVEQAPFVVLKSPDIPSLLVETGFISNAKEEVELRSSSYQHQLAYALMQGIVNYLKRYPPPDTLFAAKVNGTIRHTVQKGETLLTIAYRYHDTVDLLMKINNLKSPSLAVGQVLQIPKQG